ncbi:MAG: hypothetical protein R3Y11_01605 [Pseudomonadota bacterium]
MKTVAGFKNKVFLAEHPVITQRFILSSSGEEELLIAGSVIGVTVAATEVELDTDDASQDVADDNAVAETETVEANKIFLYGKYPNMEPLGILQGDVRVPAEGDAWATLYVHCAAVSDGLTWADGISADDQAAAVAALRKIGIFVE